jgi:hypothetical protein
MVSGTAAKKLCEQGGDYIPSVVDYGIGCCPGPELG